MNIKIEKASGNDITLVVAPQANQTITIDRNIKGNTGDAGAGVAVGGTTGQILSKLSNANYDAGWINNANGTVTSVGITPLTGVTVSNSPITASGNITVGLSTKLTAIENLSGSGFITQNGSGAIAGRTIQAGTGISVAHGNGASQDPTISNNGVLGVTGTSPVASSGGQNPVISMPAATTSVSGYLTSTDWNTFNNKLSTQVYPGAGIPNSTGTAWGTSYGVTGTGSVVLNSNPTFATDITVNGATVGRGGGNIASNIALGNTPFNSPFINALNTNNIAIGNNNLSNIGSGVATLTILNGGSGYYDIGNGTDTFSTNTILNYVSGTPVVVGGNYPTASIDVVAGVVDNVTVQSIGLGFTDTTTVFQVTLDPLSYYGSGFSCQTATLRSASNIIAIGNGAGGGDTNSNSIYIGNGVTGTASNQVIIGDALITSTTLRGAVTAGSISVPGNAAFSVASGATTTIGIGTSSGNITIGGNSFAQSLNIGGVTGTQPITFGRSTTSQVVNIATGINGTSTVKTVNIGINGVTNSTTNIVIGATSGTSTTTINGLLKQQTKTVATLPTGSAGARSFVTNALAPSFGAAVVGGGTVGVPVYYDGTSWKVG